MGRYNLAPSRVHSHASQLLQNSRHTQIYPPPWYTAIAQTPPSSKLTRPPLRRSQKAGKRSSRIFTPANLSYKEDQLRWEYFNDHPWELARPRVVLENDGRDMERWDWSVELDLSLNRPRGGSERDEYGRTDKMWDEVRTRLAGRPLNGEAVIQRQHWLLRHTALSTAAAYDKARKELYRVRHAQEIERRVAREEALNTGAFFGLGPLEIGMKLEDRAYENWRTWAEKEIVALKQLQGSAYTGTENEDAAIELEQPEQEELQEVVDAVPATNRGLRAEGGAAVHP